MYSTVTNAGFSFTYDEHGNITGVTAGEYSDGENAGISPLTSLGYGYSNDGEFRTSITDERGLTTVYDIDLPTGLTNSVTTPAYVLGLDKSLVTEYTYDEGNHNLLEAKLHCVDVNGSANSANFIAGVNYTYNNPVAQLKKITRSDGQAYNFTYDIWGRVTDIKVGNRLLSHSVYTKASNDTQLAYTEYGNGAKIYYTYDWLDRIVAQSTTDPENGGTPYVSYDYNSEGLVGRVTDNLANVKTEYHYDLLGRLVSSNMSSGYIDRYAYSYSNSNELTKASAFLRDGTLAVESEYTYDTAGRLTISKQGEYTVQYTYDVLDRVTCEKAVHEDGTEYYTYYSYLTVGSNTTSFVSAVTYKTKANGATAETTVGSVHYTYDSNGFISSVTYKNALGAVTATESYTYDALGQLKTVTNGSNVTEYTYDTAGNILSKKVNGTTVGSYTYGDSQWKDLLTSYNGQTITYDGIGNPTSYLGATLTWDMGRRLTCYDNTEVTAGYTYNASGQRTSKTVNLVDTDFFYDDRGSLVALVNDYGYDLYFYPDADGSIGSFNHNGEQYYYVRNAQNDVIGITDSTGAFVAKYTYDEWGKILTITDGNGVDVSNNPSHIANLNPFRYRSYFYDAETGFYWLNTRYYDPTVGRFINADGALYYGIVYNLYSYCYNNPIIFCDCKGNCPHLSFSDRLCDDCLNFQAGIVEETSESHDNSIPTTFPDDTLSAEDGFELFFDSVDIVIDTVGEWVADCYRNSSRPANIGPGVFPKKVEKLAEESLELTNGLSSLFGFVGYAVSVGFTIQDGIENEKSFVDVSMNVYVDTFELVAGGLLSKSVSTSVVGFATSVIGITSPAALAAICIVSAAGTSWGVSWFCDLMKS